MRIVFLDAGTLADSTTLEPLSVLGDFSSFNSTESTDISSRIRDAHVVITNKVPLSGNDLRLAKNCRLIIVAASVADIVDSAAARELGIDVAPVPGYGTESVAQWTWTLILALIGHLAAYNSSVIDGRYSAQSLFSLVGSGFREIAGRRLGVIGFGRIGKRVAEIGAAFGADVSYHSVTGLSDDSRYFRQPLPELLGSADIVSLHTPRTPLTENLMNDETLSLMRPDAILINTGRGGVVDEAALARAISARKIWGAALDVFQAEPLAADSPLLALPADGRLILTPHVAWGGVDAQAQLIADIGALIRQYRERKGHDV